MKFAIYSRKSVYTGKGESIENQIEMCRQHIFSKYPGTKEENIRIYEDEGFSGKSIDRPQFKKMFADIKRKTFDCLVCYRLDRISRNVGDFAAIIEELNNRSISFISIKESFDTTTPMGKAMLYIASVFAQLERETIAERVRDNMMMLAKTGRWLGGNAPTGYTSEKIKTESFDGKAKTTCMLKEVPEEMRVVDLIYHKFLELRSMSAVCKYLIGQGIKSRTGKAYTLHTIKEILQNPVYCTADLDALKYFRDKNADICFDEKDCGSFGILTYNKRDNKKKSVPRLSIEHWIIALGKHKGIISGADWIAIQNHIKADKPDGITPSKMHNDYSLLSGLITCEKCGQRMFAKTYSGNRTKETGAFSYICESKRIAGRNHCDSQNLIGQETDSIVCEYLKSYLKPDSDIAEHLEKMNRELSDEKSAVNPLTEIEIKIKRINLEKENLVSMLSQGQLVPAFIEGMNKKMIALENELSALAEEKTRLEKTLDGLTDSEKQYAILLELLSSFKNTFYHLSIVDKRMLIKMLVHRITWDGENLHIFINGG